jgi:photosynthetic reaction center cytochrome c subunit
MKQQRLSTLFAAALAAGFAGQATWGQAPEVKTAEQVYKNIVQLKGTPADQLPAAMQFISASLGVECETCHVRDKYEADDKGAKRTAREMMAMTATINKESFRGQQTITCYSCHRGSERPVASPPVLESDMPATPAAAAPRPPAGAAAPTADDIVTKYLTAVGGADAMKKITTRVMKGTVLAMGSETAIDLYTKAPNKRISISHMSPAATASRPSTAPWAGWAPLANRRGK